MDTQVRLQEAIQTARSEQRQLVVVGDASKRNWYAPVSAQMLAMTEHVGIVAYDPAELVVTVRSGTPIRDLLAELAQAGQELAFEAPQFYGSGTVGGMIGAGLTGTSRPWRGSVRDAVLGVTVINGLGQILTFGGQVMKNVAGYDVSRLYSGSCGALGPILEVSLRTRPLSAQTMTTRFAMDASRANQFCRQLARRYLPLSGTWWHEGSLYLRMSGSQQAVEAAATQLGGEHSDSKVLWQRVANHADEFFKPTAVDAPERQGKQLWRVVVPPASPMPDLSTNSFSWEWSGGLRWLWHDDESFVQDYAHRHQGWAWALGTPVTLELGHRTLMRSIKKAFDEDNLFANPLGLDEQAEPAVSANP